MTRKEQIDDVVTKIVEERESAIGRQKYGGWYFAYWFKEGVEWADEHPKSPWIKFKGRKPKMGRLNTVIVKQGKYVFIAYSCYFNGRFHWNMCGTGYKPALDNDHWMLIPKLEEE